MHSKINSVLDYICHRELGNSNISEQVHISDNITAMRTTNPILADTPIHSRSTYLLRLNYDNKLTAAAHGDRSIAIYSAITGSILATCDGHERSPWTLSFHPSDPFLLASGCLGGSIRLWNLKCLSEFCELVTTSPATPIVLNATRVWKQAGAIASLSFHPLYPILIAAWAQEVVFYDWLSGRTLSIWRFVSDYSRVRWVKLSPNGSLLYTATANPIEDQASLANFSRSQSAISSSSNISSTDGSEEFMDSPSPSIKCRTDSSQQEDKRTILTRHELLIYLLTRPNSWYHQLGVCCACSVRLCKWAGALGSVFPSQPHQPEQNLASSRLAVGLLKARQQATALISTGVLVSPLPYAVQKLLADEDLSDPHPAAVAVIEDLPTKEFLLSRGTYCHRKDSSPGVFSDVGMCCGGHACDLVFTHRELMRYSLCRSCLQAFWRWTTGVVDWWTWLEPQNNELSPSSSMQIGSFNKHEINKTIDSSSVEFSHPIGICLQCSIGVKQPGAPYSKSVLICPPNNCTSRVDDDVEAGSRSPGQQISVTRAALKLLRDRLNNANEVTHITFLATRIINDDKVTAHIRTLLNRQPSSTEVTEVGLLWSKLLGRDVAEHSLKSSSKSLITSAKRARIACESSTCSMPISTSPSDNEAEIDDRDSSNDGLSLGLVTEAAELAKSVANAVWNRQVAVSIVSSTQATILTSPPHPEYVLFPYVHVGSFLLNFEEKATLPKSETFLQQAKSPQPSRAGGSAEPVSVHGGMRVCCKCGCLVPHTFPVSPQSSLNHAVCSNILFSGEPSTSSRSPRSINTSSNDVSQPIISQDTAFTTPNFNNQTDCKVSSSTPSQQQHHDVGNLFSLLHRSRSSSFLNSMQQGITNVVAGLLSDMGDHGSACGLRNTTYRICRWELTLCEPVPREDDCLIEATSTHHDNLFSSFSQSCMPANVAVSYSKNSLVVPHVRIFNDSSICISHNGCLLGAFVISQSNHTTPVTQGQLVDNRNNLMENLLAIFRLEPCHRRGQCIYARKFGSENPVCLDFSPGASMLVVGLAATRLTGNENGDQHQLEIQSSAKSKAASVVRIFKIDQTYHQQGKNQNEDCLQSNGRSGLRRLSRVLRQVRQFSHPRSMLLRQTSGNQSQSVEQWHRSLILAPGGISVNTIVWCSGGGIIYGTTKGLIVMLRPQPTPITFQETSLISPDPDVEEEEIEIEDHNLIKKEQHLYDFSGTSLIHADR